MNQIRAPRKSAESYANDMLQLIENILATTRAEVRAGLAQELARLTHPRGRKDLDRIVRQYKMEPSLIDEAFLAGIALAAVMVGHSDLHY
jgi:hypothetical protein